MIPIHQTKIDDLADPLMDEVRRIRRTISEQYDGCVDRLCDHLITVGEDYSARRGVFASVSAEAAAKVIESWGAEARRHDDPLVDEVREIRRRQWNGRTVDDPPLGPK